MTFSRALRPTPACTAYRSSSNSPPARRRSDSAREGHRVREPKRIPANAPARRNGPNGIADLRPTRRMRMRPLPNTALEQEPGEGTDQQDSPAAPPQVGPERRGEFHIAEAEAPGVDQEQHEAAGAEGERTEQRGAPTAADTGQQRGPCEPDDRGHRQRQRDDVGQPVYREVDGSTAARPATPTTEPTASPHRPHPPQINSAEG